MKTVGYGLLQAWPMLVETGDVIYGLEERGEIRLEGEFWTLRQQGTAVTTVHQSIGIVTWETHPTAARARLADTIEREPTAPAALAAPLHKCPYCKNEYTRKIDALVCERSCSDGIPSGPSCAKCGYQLADHVGIGAQGLESVAANTLQGCPLKTGEVIRWDPRAVRITQAERDRVEREAIERSDKQDLTGMITKLQRLVGENGGSIWGESLCMLQRQSEGLTGKAKLELRAELGVLIDKMRADGTLPVPFGKSPPEWVQQFLAIYEGRA